MQVLCDVVDAIGPAAAAAAVTGRAAAVLALDPDLVAVDDPAALRVPQSSIEQAEVRLFDGIVERTGGNPFFVGELVSLPGPPRPT
ncbi:MAG: hypothetical protein ABS81_01510 [Pseudonocardia sp. SCN 72-86]|nr:MAG: hypothetical protein ABS81_01510 [Pseudonocardia sp. SCN 72-86]